MSIGSSNDGKQKQRIELPQGVTDWMEKTKEVPFSSLSSWFQHIDRSRVVMEKWCTPEWVVLAGVMSSAYGTQFFDPPKGLILSRPQVVELIGELPESIVYQFSTLNRRRAHLDGTFMNRVTGKVWVELYMSAAMPSRDALNLIEAADMLAEAKRISLSLSNRLTLNSLTPQLNFGVHEVERRQSELESYDGY